MTAPTSKARDPFSAARDDFVMAVLRHVQGEAAVKVAIALVVNYASRAEFERTGRLVAWPSLRTVAEMVGMFRGRLSRGLAILEDGGWLTIERPVKRGVGHHFKYFLNVVEAAPAAAEAPKRKRSDTSKTTATVGAIGPTTVANSDAAIGLGAEANQQAAIGLTGEDELASPVRTNLLEDTLEGAGAHSARPAPCSSDDVSVDEVVQTQDQQDGKDGGARERAPVIHALSSAKVDPFDPDAWRAEPEFSAGAAVNGKGAGCATKGASTDPAADLRDGKSLADLGLTDDDLDPLRDVMDSAAADGARHGLSAQELAAALILGFCHNDQDQAERALTDAGDVLAGLARIGQSDDTTTTPSEHAAKLCRALRMLARKADRAAPGAVAPDRAVSALLSALGFPGAVPGGTSAAHGLGLADRVSAAARDLDALFHSRVQRADQLARDLNEGLGQSADPDALDRAVATVRVVATPRDWQFLTAIVDELVGVGGGSDLAGAVAETELAEMEDLENGF